MRNFKVMDVEIGDFKMTYRFIYYPKVERDISEYLAIKYMQKMYKNSEYGNNFLYDDDELHKKNIITSIINLNSTTWDEGEY